MKRSLKLKAIGAGAAISVASFVAIVPSALAETTTTTAPPTTVASSIVDIASNLTGQLSLAKSGADPVVLPVPSGSTFTGTLDTTTGDLTGSVNIVPGSVTFDVTDPAPTSATIYYSFTSGGPITDGRIEPDGTVTFTDVQTLALTKLTVALLPDDEFDLEPTCRFVNIKLDYTGTYDADTGAVNVTSATIDTPALEGACGKIINGLVDVTEQVNGLIGGSTTTATLGFNAAVEDIEEPEPPVTVPPTTPGTTVPGGTTSPIAKPVKASPKYTG